MSQLLNTLVVSLFTVIISIPTLAQDIRIESSSQQAITFDGKKCFTINDVNKVLLCKKLIITGFAGNSKALNFHFVSDNQSTISYITKRFAVVENGIEIYEIEAFYLLKANGEASGVYSAGGKCKAKNLLDENILDDPSIICELDNTGLNKFFMRSIYNKKSSDLR